MADRGKYPEGFVSILESRSLVGQAVYGERWPKIVRRLQAHDRSEARLVQAAKKQNQDGVSTSIAKWRKTQAQTYPEWARLLTEMDRLVASGRLRLYLWQQDHLPVPLPGSLIVGDGPEQIWLRQHIFITGRTAVMPSGGDLAIPRAISIVDRFRDADSAEVIVLERGVHQALLEVGYLDESDSARTANGSSGERRGSSAPGRPSCREEIKTAYMELRDSGEVDFDKPKNTIYGPIREKVCPKKGDRKLQKGLGDEAIRKVISPLFEADKTKHLAPI